MPTSKEVLDKINNIRAARKATYRCYRAAADAHEPASHFIDEMRTFDKEEKGLRDEHFTLFGFYPK